MRAKPSAYFNAKVLGVISPKTKKVKVRMPVIIPREALPKSLIPQTVATMVAQMLTKLFPSKIVISKLSGWVFNLYMALTPKRTLSL